MREIILTDVDAGELRAALDAEGLTAVEVGEPDEDGAITVGVPDGVDGISVDLALRRYADARMSGRVATLAPVAGLVPEGGGVGGFGAAVVQYKEFIALFSQAGLTDPEVTVLKNTLGGEPVWTRDSAGVYVGTLAGAFPAGRTVSPNKFQVLSPPTSGDLAMSVSVATEDSVSVETTTYSTGDFIDGALDATLVEIRVYDRL